jgi:hypothetical protein
LQKNRKAIAGVTNRRQVTMVGIHAATSLYSSILDMPPNKSLVRMIQAGSAAVQKNIILVLMVLKRMNIRQEPASTGK